MLRRLQAGYKTRGKGRARCALSSLHHEKDTSMPRHSRIGRPLCLLALFTVLTAASPVRATLIKSDFLSPGDGLLITDDATGLEWLSPYATRDHSYNEIVGGYAGLVTTEGFVYATRAQVLSLIADNFGTPPAAPGSPAGYAIAADFFDVFGINLNLGCSSGFTPVPCPRTQGLVSDPGTSAGSRVAIGMIQFGTNGYLIDNTFGWGQSLHDLQLGSWLVRPATLPEPATVVLGGLGLAALAARRRLHG